MVADAMDEARIIPAVPRFRVRWVSQTGSTNADLLAAASRGEPDGLVLAADHQLAGKGRRGRSWEATPQGALLFSLLLRPALRPEAAPLVSLALSLGAVQACAELTGTAPGLKWPNDLVVGDRKLAGVLSESLVAGGRLQAVVVGMGLNVRPGVVPAELAATAVALDELADDPVDRRSLLEAVLVHTALWLAALDGPQGAAAVLDAARQHSATLGRKVRVELATEATTKPAAESATSELIGQAVDMDETGALLLDGGRRVTVGDVVHLHQVRSEGSEGSGS